MLSFSPAARSAPSVAADAPAAGDVSFSRVAPAAVASRAIRICSSHLPGRVSDAGGGARRGLLLLVFRRSIEEKTMCFPFRTIDLDGLVEKNKNYFISRLSFILSVSFFLLVHHFALSLSLSFSLSFFSFFCSSLQKKAVSSEAYQNMERDPWFSEKNCSGPFPVWKEGETPLGCKPDGGGCHRSQGKVGAMVLHRAACNRDMKG